MVAVDVLDTAGLAESGDVHVVSTDADDLCRIAGRVLGIPGVERTNIALAMRELVGYRIRPLLEKLAEG